MPDKIEITIDVIVHCTEDPSKILASFKDTFDLDEENFTINNTVGHYEKSNNHDEGQNNQNAGQSTAQKTARIIEKRTSCEIN